MFEKRTHKDVYGNPAGLTNHNFVLRFAGLGTARTCSSPRQIPGDAYIHGVMRGEGLDSLDGGIRDIALI